VALPSAPDPVKLFAALLWSEAEALAAARSRLAERFGAIDFEGPPHPFEETNYYEAEMGAGLRRSFLAFEMLISPDDLAEAKLAAIAIEEALRGPAGRRANIDPGYFDLHKTVLASVKYGAMKVYLGRGIYADIVCRYSRGKLQHVDWTFQDFRDGRYDPDLLEIRRRYVEQLRARPK